MKIGTFLSEVKTEMSHVAFPTKRQAILFTVLVVVLSIFVAIYLGLFDYIFKLGVERLLNI